MSREGTGRIEAIVSDFGGVLTTPLIQSFAAFQDETGITPESLGRAMGRQIEQLMLHLAVRAAVHAQCDSVVARFVPTSKNRPCLEFWQGSAFANPEQNVFVWKAADDYPKPEFITLEGNFGPVDQMTPAI